MFYKIARAVCVLLTRLIFRIEVAGAENVPKGGGYILAANHRTNFDPLFVANRVTEQIFFMAKAELFEKNRFVGFIVKALGAFPVERGKGDTGAIDWAGKVLETGGILGMFPEGTRSKTGDLGRPKSGAAMIAQQTGADVLPCAICFGESLKLRTRVSIRYGRLLPNGELGFSGKELSAHEMKAASRRIMEEIAALMEDRP